MRTSICRKVLFAGLIATASFGHAQNEPGRAPASIDLAITYSTEHAQLAPGTCGCFWLQGEEAMPPLHGGRDLESLQG